MITVALPTWNSKQILWLPMEGLCRQKTEFAWELIVLECRSPHEVGYEFFESYWDRLKKAGCKRLKYIFTGKRIPLGQKWKEIAKEAKGEYFILQASDDYPHSRRIQVTGDKLPGHDWYDTRFFHSFSLKSKKLILFDASMLARWTTGNDMATLTEKVRRLPDNNKSRGVDFFLYETLVDNRVIDDNLYPGVNTNGANNISMSREMHFISPRPPFKKAYRTIDELGLPKEIVTKLKHMTLNGHDKVEATLIKKFMNRRPGDKMKLNFRSYTTLEASGVLQLEPSEPYTRNYEN